MIANKPVASIATCQLARTAELRPIPSIWATSPPWVNPSDDQFIDVALRELLAG